MSNMVLGGTSHHFIDANIAIGCSASFDYHYGTVSGYFREDVTFHYSELLENETIDVLERKEQTALNIIEQSHHELRKIYDPDEDDVSDVFKDIGVGRFAANKELHDHFLSYHEDRLAELLSEGNKNEAQMFIVDAFSSARRQLRNNLERSNFCKQDCSGSGHKSSNAFNKLNKKIGVPRADSFLVLDSEEVADELGETVLFVSLDKNHIVSNKKQIEKVISDVDVRHPKDFL